MNSLAYLIIRSAKNRLLQLLRSPGKLIMYLLVIGMIAGAFMTSMFARNQREEFAELFWLKGILFALILFFFITAIIKGLKSGDVIFNMNDVNLLFVSPLSPQSILLYGVVKMMSSSFLAGFFILFQSNTLGVSFGIHFDDILLILLGFILAVSFMQIVTLLIYSMTNGNKKRKMAVRLIAIALFVPLAATAGWQLVQTNGSLMEMLTYLLQSPVLSWTPVVGWTSEGALAFIAGNITWGGVYWGLIIASGIVMILYIMRSNIDYYEDVLVASEIAFERKRAVAEGQINNMAVSGRKVRVAATGIRGAGASAIFYKHLREAFRSNRLGLWSTSSLLMVAAVAFYAWIFSKSDFNGPLLFILGLLMWIQLFMTGTGRGLRELYNHYIYMIPEPPFQKVVWSNIETVFKNLIEGLLMFGFAGIILRESFLMIMMAVLVFTLFCLLSIGLNYLSMRWTGADISAGLLVALYFFGTFIIMMPGMIAAVIIGLFAGTWGVPIGMAVLAGWELLAAMGCFALSKGIIHSCDMPVIKTK